MQQSKSATFDRLFMQWKFKVATDGNGHKDDYSKYLTVDGFEMFPISLHLCILCYHMHINGNLQPVAPCNNIHTRTDTHTSLAQPALLSTCTPVIYGYLFLLLLFLPAISLSFFMFRTVFSMCLITCCCNKVAGMKVL